MAKANKTIEKIYFVGINGTAMSGLAVMAKQLGYKVAGSDEKAEFPTDHVLTDNDIKVYKGFDQNNIVAETPDAVVISAAYGKANPEVKYLQKKRLQIFTSSEMLAKLIEKFENIGISGVHGKTTTTSLTAFILKEAGYSPGYMIGTDKIAGLDDNAHIGDGKFFVLEADEYKKSAEDDQPKFLDYPIRYLVVTSIELDHPDLYQTAEDVYQAFYRLASKVPRDGLIVACTDWPYVKRLATRKADRKCLTYGLKAPADYQVIDLTEGATTTFRLKHEDKYLGPYEINLPGSYNALNATAAIILCRELGVTDDAIKKIIKKFAGPSRRFELLGEYNGAPVIDDFAHHPTAVEGVIQAAKKRYPNKKITAVFQPHTYSRTGRFLKEYAESLKEADRIVLLNIFASAREKTGYVTINDLIKEVRGVRKDAEYRSTLEEATLYLASTLSHDDVLLLIGAGNVYQIFGKLKEIEKNSSS